VSSRKTRADVDEATQARLEDLEVRVKQLEARLRATLAQARRDSGRGRKTVARPEPRRPRCPGCTLELPAGRRGESCVWCGFRFDAVSGLLR